MTESTLTKLCANCNELRVYSPDKKISQFYVRSGIKNPTEPGHYISECKSCMAKRNLHRTPIGEEESRVYTENLAIKRLKSAGIWAQTGKSSQAPDVDVTAMGSVWIEVKYSLLDFRRGVKMFKFETTPKQQQRGFLADIVMLICEWSPRVYTYHLFRATDEVFYMKGRVKSAFTFVPGRTVALKHGNNRVVMVQSMMDAAQNNWALVEEIYREHAAQLPSNPFPHRRCRGDEQTA